MDYSDDAPGRMLYNIDVSKKSKKEVWEILYKFNNATYNLDARGNITSEGTLPIFNKGNLEIALLNGGTLYLQDMDSKIANMMSKDKELKDLMIPHHSVFVIYTQGDDRSKNVDIEDTLKKLPWVFDVVNEETIFPSESEPVDSHHTDSFAVYHLNLLGLVSQNNPLPSKYKENIKTSLCEGGTLFLQNISTRKANLMAEDEELQKLGIKPNSVLVVYVKSNARWNDKNIERVLKKLPWIWDVRVDISGQLELVVK